MAQQGSTDKVGSSTTDQKEKDFKDTPVEGKKSDDELNEIKGRVVAIVKAIATLDPKSGFTESGMPDVKALEQALGFDTTAEEREVIFVIYEAVKELPALQCSKEETAEIKKRLFSIVKAIATLDPEKDFTKSGMPEVKAIEETLGHDITAEERDAAFGLFRAVKEMSSPQSAEEPTKKAIVTGEDVLRGKKKKKAGDDDEK